MGKHCSLFEFSEDSWVQGYTVRAVRDWLHSWSPRHKLKQREEKKAPGIYVPEPIELDILLEEIREQEKSAEENSDTLRNEKDKGKSRCCKGNQAGGPADNGKKERW